MARFGFFLARPSGFETLRVQSLPRFRHLTHADDCASKMHLTFAWWQSLHAARSIVLGGRSGLGELGKWWPPVFGQVREVLSDLELELELELEDAMMSLERMKC